MFSIIQKNILWHLVFEYYLFHMFSAAISQMVHPLSPNFDETFKHFDQ